MAFRWAICWCMRPSVSQWPRQPHEKLPTAIGVSVLNILVEQVLSVFGVVDRERLVREQHLVERAILVGVEHAQIAAKDLIGLLVSLGSSAPVGPRRCNQAPGGWAGSDLPRAGPRCRFGHTCGQSGRSRQGLGRHRGQAASTWGAMTARRYWSEKVG